MNPLDKILPIASYVRDMPYTMVFKTTNYCWFNCPHCCESSGPNQAKTFIPMGAIYHFLNSAVADPKFSGDVVFTGGEIMSAYKFGPKNYVPTLLNMCLDAKLGTDIKTNGGWAKTTFGKKIFQDLGDTIEKHDNFALSVSLSLDKYHTNCLENNAHILKTLADNGHHVSVNLASFDSDRHMYDQLLGRLAKSNVNIGEYIITKGDTAQTVKMLNNCVILRYRTATLFRGGRANNLNDAQKINFPQFSFLSPNLTVLMAFDSFGNVTLGENSGKKISTPWVAPFSRVYNFDAIRRRLVRGARMAELRATICDGWCPQNTK